MTSFAENRILEPLDPVPEDVNDWPDFSLRDVKIFYQGKGRYADLLEACDSVPLCVLGELLPLEDEQQDLALVDKPDYVRIKIDNVTNYSFGQDDTGKPVIWAAGKAGWYEITPSDRYLIHYNDTIEAIDLFYSMVDQHHKLPRKRQRKGFMIDPFLTAYQKHTDYRIEDDDEAMETIHKHHKFILRQMIEEREGIDWSQTHLWEHLTEVYSDELKSIRASSMVLNPKIHQSDDNTSAGETGSENSTVERDDVDGSADSAAQSVQDDEEEEDEEENEPGPEQEEEEDEEQEEHDNSRDWTQAIWNLLNILRKTASFDMRQCGIDQLAFEVQKLPDFPQHSHKKAFTAIERSAEPLLRLMNEAKLRKKFNWSTRRIYNDLEATLADDIADQIMKTPAQKPNKKHRQKSVLRPSGASKTRKRIRTVDDSEGDSGMDPPTALVSATAPSARRKLTQRDRREVTVETAASLEDDSPSRQLNGHTNHDFEGLPELPPGPETKEMLDLVAKEAKMVGRAHQTSHLEAFLGQWVV